jgi:hypothetical protein
MGNKTSLTDVTPEDVRCAIDRKNVLTPEQCMAMHDVYISVLVPIEIYRDHNPHKACPDMMRQQQYDRAIGKGDGARIGYHRGAIYAFRFTGFDTHYVLFECNNAKNYNASRKALHQYRAQSPVAQPIVLTTIHGNCRCHRCDGIVWVMNVVFCKANGEEGLASEEPLSVGPFFR